MGDSCSQWNCWVWNVETVVSASCHNSTLPPPSLSPPSSLPSLTLGSRQASLLWRRVSHAMFVCILVCFGTRAHLLPASVLSLQVSWLHITRGDPSTAGNRRWQLSSSQWPEPGWLLQPLFCVSMELSSLCGYGCCLLCVSMACVSMGVVFLCGWRYLICSCRVYTLLVIIFPRPLP